MAPVTAAQLIVKLVAKTDAAVGSAGAAGAVSCDAVGEFDDQPALARRPDAERVAHGRTLR